MTLYDTGVALMHPHIPNYLLSGMTPGLTGNAHPNISPYDTFPTKTGRDLPRRRQRPRLQAGVHGARAARAGRRAALRAQRRPRRQPRRAHRGARDAARRGRRGRALPTRLLEIGVPAGPILDVAQLLEHPHTRHREMLAELGELPRLRHPDQALAHAGRDPPPAASASAPRAARSSPRPASPSRRSRRSPRAGPSSRSGGAPEIGYETAARSAGTISRP